MARIIMAAEGDNLVNDATLTAGSADASFPVTNLQLADPSMYCRLDNLASSYVQVDFGSPKSFDLMALIHAKTTIGRNLLTDTDDIGSAANWTVNKATVAPLSEAAPPPAARFNVAQSFTGDGTSGEHYAEHSYDMAAYSTKLNTSGQSVDFVFSAWILGQGPTLNARLRVDLGGSFAYVDIDLPAGTINGTTVSGNFTATSAIGSSVNGYYPVDLFCTYSSTTASAQTIQARIQSLDGSFNATYSTPTHEIDFIAPRLYVGMTTQEPPDESLTATAPVVVFKAHTASMTPSDFGSTTKVQSLAMSAVAGSAVTTLHSWYFQSAAYRYALAEIHDQDNADSRVDLSGLYIGPTFQPGVGLPYDGIQKQWLEPDAGNGRFRPRGDRFRLWTMRLHYLSEAEAYGDLDRIAQKVGQSGYVLVIEDPDETSYGQQKCIYGRLNMTMASVGYTVEHDGAYWRAEIEIQEVLP